MTAVAVRRYRHGTAVEPTPPKETTPANDEVKKEDAVSLSPSGTERGELKLSPLEAVIGGAAAGAAGEKLAPPPPPPQIPTLNLAPGEWVHHFDTYGLAKSLEGSGFKRGQSVTIMKGIRGLLMENLEVAKENLVSKSNVENVCFTFHISHFTLFFEHF